MALDLFRVMVVGTVYALLYLRTKNLFLVIGVHALGDAPTALFTSTLVQPSTLTLFVAVLTMLAWPLINRSYAKRSKPGRALSSQHSQALP